MQSTPVATVRVTPLSQTHIAAHITAAHYLLELGSCDAGAEVASQGKQEMEVRDSLRLRVEGSQAHSSEVVHIELED